MERAYQPLGDDVEYELAPTWPQSKPLRGRAEVVEFFQDLHETFPDVRTGALDFAELSRRHLIVGFSVIGTGRMSGLRYEMEVWQVWEFGESGIPVRVREYGDRGAALSAAEGTCPHCGGPAEYQNVRYPRALCHACDLRATDLTGRPVGLTNESLSGGFIAFHHDDETRCEQVTADGRVLIDGIEYRAGEAHMGGCVVQPVTVRR